MGPDMHLHVVHRFMVARVVSFAPKTSLKNKWTFESRQNTYWSKPSAQITLYDCAGRLLQVEWMVRCKLSRVVCVQVPMNKIFKLSKFYGGGGNKWMFGSSKFVKRWKVRQIVHHGVYKNSYSPYGGWYNASTDALVALVPSVLTLFVWWNEGKWPQNCQKCEAPKKRPNNGFLLVLYMRSHVRHTWGTRSIYKITIT